jgi:DNA (cytosine-5)-methyltransferase 1
MKKPIPVIDLFAGPGGLGEGFSAVVDGTGKPIFNIQLSIEKDPIAHQTLTLRAIFRHLSKTLVPEIYYSYISGAVDRDTFFSDPVIKNTLIEVQKEAHCLELGDQTKDHVDKLIQEALGNKSEWVLIGGPPCQAYSIAGRSRRINVDPDFHKDPKHLLYREYLRIIEKFRPSVFVMENVKGILSSTHDGGLIFNKIIQDLSNPAEDISYEIRSFVTPLTDKGLKPRDFTIRTEEYGVPQMRHRVILLGIRIDKANTKHNLIVSRTPKTTLGNILEGLLPIRSRLSKELDSHSTWLSAIKETKHCLNDLPQDMQTRVLEVMAENEIKAAENIDAGKPFAAQKVKFSGLLTADLVSWLKDDRLKGVCQHESRSHMRTDLHRYFFAACMTKINGSSPKLNTYPKKLLPAHKNADHVDTPFGDRFRVQLKDSPSSTVVSHISKDGHYYIHPDPSQCRSLTVREAARLQTFPDNYYFEGGRTQQYHQVGNAVPPFLAKQLAESVATFMQESGSA